MARHDDRQVFKVRMAHVRLTNGSGEPAEVNVTISAADISAAEVEATKLTAQLNGLLRVAEIAESGPRSRSIRPRHGRDGILSTSERPSLS